MRDEGAGEEQNLLPRRRRHRRAAPRGGRPEVTDSKLVNDILRKILGL
ncbi:MAG: hypothetical protein ACLVL7_05720 [Anaerotruncus massiliensis (ex Togo et al. 2019)]